jgi:hypothetical protein
VGFKKLGTQVMTLWVIVIFFLNLVSFVGDDVHRSVNRRRLWKLLATDISHFQFWNKYGSLIPYVVIREKNYRILSQTTTKIILSIKINPIFFPSALESSHV